MVKMTPADVIRFIIQGYPDPYVRMEELAEPLYDGNSGHRRIAALLLRGEQPTGDEVEEILAKAALGGPVRRFLDQFMSGRVDQHP